MLNPAPVSAPREVVLTVAQTHVFYLLVEGLSNLQIGDELALAEKTVKAHVTNIMRSARLENRVRVSAAYWRGNLRIVTEIARGAFP